MTNILHKIESVVEWTFKWFIVYLLVGEAIFLTVGYVIPRFIFYLEIDMKMWLEEIGTAILLFGLMYLVAVIMFSL